MKPEDIRQTLTSKFDELSATLEGLQSRVREMRHEARAKWESDLAALERQRREARAKVNDFRSDSAEAWETFKSGMESTWQSLKKTCEETLKTLQKE